MPDNKIIGRAVIDDVERIGFDRHLCPFPGSLYSCLKYIKDPQPYEFLMGVTCAAFRRLFEKNDGGNVDLMHIGPEPYRRIFTSLNYDYQVISPEDRGKLVRAAKESIDSGRPVLAFGIIGPPECGIVTGYDQGGDVLIGYSYFQDPALQGYYEQPDWYENAAWMHDLGFIVIGDKKKTEGPSTRDTLISSLMWAIDLAKRPQRPEIPDHASGLAAYDAWADGLETDADYPENDMETLGWRVMIHGDQCMMQDDRRWGAGFLRSMVDFAPEASGDLDAAAELYDEVAGGVGRLWPWESCDYNDPELKRKIADPGTRKGLAEAVRASRDKEADAVGYLESALAALG